MCQSKYQKKTESINWAHTSKEKKLFFVENKGVCVSRTRYHYFFTKDGTRKNHNPSKFLICVYNAQWTKFSSSKGTGQTSYFQRTNLKSNFEAPIILTDATTVHSDRQSYKPSQRFSGKKKVKTAFFFSRATNNFEILTLDSSNEILFEFANSSGL